MLETGMTGTAETMVTNENTAHALCSGALEVFATPAMIALMEECCFKMVQPELEEGMGTVGTGLNIEHLAPTPVGMKVKCQGRLTAVEGRKLVFEVEVSDETGTVIGKGSHQRFIINSEKFQAKANAKLNA